MQDKKCSNLFWQHEESKNQRLIVFFDSDDKFKILLSLFRLKHIVSKLAAGAQTTTVLPAALSGIVTFNSGWTQN